MKYITHVGSFVAPKHLRFSKIGKKHEEVFFFVQLSEQEDYYLHFGGCKYCCAVYTGQQLSSHKQLRKLKFKLPLFPGSYLLTDKEGNFYYKHTRFLKFTLKIPKFLMASSQELAFLFAGHSG